MNSNAFSENQQKFTALFNGSPDVLSLVVKAHYSIDKLLDFVLLLRIPNADSVELRRVAFLLKVDLGTGMGLLRKDLRPVFNLINTVRNRFAHDPYSEFSEKDAKNAKNVLLQPIPAVVTDAFKSESSPREILESLFAVGFANAIVAYEVACTHNAEMHVTNEMSRETLSGGRKGRELGISVEDDFRARLKEYMGKFHPEVR